MNIPIVGDILEVTDLNFSGYPEPVVYYQWIRSDLNISGETGATYNVSLEDVGYTLGVKITLSNFYGSVSRTIFADALTNNSSPYFNTQPLPSEINPIVGSFVYIENISVFGIPEPTLTYSWYLNDSLISGATGISYETEEYGTLRANIIATNIYGSAGATVDFGTVLPRDDESDWDTYRDGIYRLPAVLDNQTRTVTVLEGPTDLSTLSGAFVE